MSGLSSTALRAKRFLIYVPIKMSSKNAVTFWQDPYEEMQSLSGKVMALFSCDDTDDSSQNQAKIAESLDFSVAPCFKIKKNADHRDTQ